MYYSISEDVLNQVLAVLIQLPYNQSADVIHALQKEIQKVNRSPANPDTSE